MSDYTEEQRPVLEHWEQHSFVADATDPSRCHQWVWFVGKPVLCGCRENEPVHLGPLAERKEG